MVLSLPLLVGTDGEKKMSKSLKNAVGLLDPPGEMFGKLMSIPDSATATYALLLTRLSEREIADLHPREAKATVAQAITGRFHGEEAARTAREEFDRQFSRRELPAEIAGFLVEGPYPVRLSTVMVRSGAARSESLAKQLIRQGAVDLDGSPVSDLFCEVVPAGQLLRVGKRFYCRLLASEG